MKKGCLINPLSFEDNFQSEKSPSPFSYQHDYFNDQFDPCYPDPILKGLDTTLFADSSCECKNKKWEATKVRAGLVASARPEWRLYRQPSIKTSKCRLELNVLKVIVEWSITLTCHLRYMGIPVTKK